VKRVQRVKRVKRVRRVRRVQRGFLYDGRVMFLLRLLTRKRGSAMDPLQVSMTGVRMGERFLQIGCGDRALLSGLAAKVGLSGTAAVAAANSRQAALAESIGRKVGALVDVRNIDTGREWPFDSAAFDMVVVDNTDDSFHGYASPGAILQNGLDSLRPGGRIEVVSPMKSEHANADFVQLLTDAGFRPVRVLAEINGLRFVEGLKPASS
jgi:SAM-dependent methyltransferase